MSKTLIVTGASGNLGSAVAKKFKDEKYDVTGIVHPHSTSKSEAENDIESVELNLLDADNCQKAVDNIVIKKGNIDVAVLTAGGFAMGNIGHTSVEDIYQQYQLNFETAFNIARPIFLQMMKQNNGRLFLIGSRAGLDVSKAKGTIAYALSKSLIFRLAEILNAEAAGKNVVVNVIVPSIIDTEQNRKAMPDEDYTHWVQPSEIADIIFYYSEKGAEAIREPVIKIYKNS